MSTIDEPPPGTGGLEGAAAEDERRVLALARAALSPSGADEERVWRSLAAIMALAPAPAADAPPPTEGPPPAVSHARGPSRGGLANGSERGAGARAWVRRMVGAAAIAATAGSAGYRLGERAGRRDVTNAAAGHSAAPSLAAPPASPRLPREALERQSPGEPASPLLPAPPRSPDTRRHPAAGTARPSSSHSLEEEVRAVRAVERALRDGSPGLALALLGELDRAVPNGRLVEERAATSAIARCNLGQAPFGVRLDEDFADRFGDSVYLKRVRRACAIGDGGAEPREGQK